MPSKVEVDFPIDYVADKLANATGGVAPARAEGWHITDIIKASKELAQGKAVNPDDFYCAGDGAHKELSKDLARAKELGLLDMGHFWEAAARPALVQWCGSKFGLLATGPQQAEADGIIANADALVKDPYTQSVVAVAECKFRFSARTEPLANEEWMQQVKGYCHIWGTSAVWMVVGNVRQAPPGAGSRIYMLTFTDDEINENWQMLVNTRQYLERERGIVDSDLPDPFSPDDLGQTAPEVADLPDPFAPDDLEPIAPEVADPSAPGFSYSALTEQWSNEENVAPNG